MRSSGAPILRRRIGRPEGGRGGPAGPTGRDASRVLERRWPGLSRGGEYDVYA